MSWRLHTGGRWRRRLGRALGGDEALGDRAWRRIVHMGGALALLYFVLPSPLLGLLPTWTIIVAALGLVALLELLRHGAGLELPTLRPHEEHRVASYVYYGAALAIAVLLLPRVIAVPVVLGTAFIDPLAGELRLRRVGPGRQWGLPIGVYFALALGGIAVAGNWPLPWIVAGSGAAAVAAVLAERPRYRWYDDDLAMTLAPALVLLLLARAGGLG